MTAGLAAFPHYHLVRKVVGQMGRSLPRHVELDDLFQVGAIAALRAATTFDGRGSFEGWASTQIRRAIIDELRLTPLVGQWRARARRHVGHDAQTDFNAPHGPTASNLDDTRLLHRLGVLETSSVHPDPLLRARLIAAIRSLTPHQRRVIVDVYLRDQQQQEVAITMGLCSTRISQLHTAAIKKLRQRLKEAA